ncbi:MAG TPA: diguanylate cyclase [Steroidobacteraceae bacterium]|nr:diguanylate cyclase [Steroidobacteraceae bacterium]
MRGVTQSLARGSDSATAETRAADLEQVLDQTGEAVIIKDLNAVVTYWNREAASLYGFSAQEAIGKSLRDLHAADLSEADYARVLERVRAGRPTASFAERCKKNSEVVRVALKTAPLLDTHGQLVGEITVARDITTLHRTEEALHAAQATLHAKLAAIRDANRRLTREIAARRKADSAMRRNNQALAATVRQLESIHRDGADLSHMAELLQACTQRSEAYAIVRETGAQLFPDSSGSLFIYRESRDVLEHVTSWGSGQAPEKTLVPDECWALRLGNPHFAPRKGAVRCRHAHDDTESYVCMPIQGQGQVLGLFHIAIDVSARTRRPAQDSELRLRAMTDRVGPALANLKLRDSLRQMALRDGLTGLYNRRYFEDVLGRELHRAERSGKPISVIMIDIDNFKLFNDKHGHDAGDFVLSAVARAISNNIRPSDIACRYGGEEVAVVLPETNRECARDRAERMLRAFRDINLVHAGQTLPAPTASFGVAVYPEHGAKPAELLKAADQALYRAKQEGRDRVCVAAASTPAGT